MIRLLQIAKTPVCSNPYTGPKDTVESEMPVKFIGRNAEIKTLNQLLERRIPCLVVIKGRRRIGKTRLVKEFCKDKQLYQFIGIAPKKGVTDQTQRDDFARRLKTYFPELPNLKADEWAELFSELKKQLCKTEKKQKKIIFLDEISWMAMEDPTFLGKLKNAWDEEFKEIDNVMLIVCGSISMWIEKNILSSTAFYGRVNHILTLKELPLTVCNQFWGNYIDKVSDYDKLKYLSISGGIPFYLENMQPQLPVDENIKQLCFTEGGLLLREFSNIFHDLFGKRSEIYKKIVTTLLTKPANAAEISKKIHTSQSGIISQYLEDLTEAGLISRDYTWHIKNNNRSKLSHYRLSDNYVRFYLSFLENKLVKQQEKIKAGIYSEVSISALPEWSTVMGLQFENLILSNRKLIWQQMGINPQDIAVDGPFFQRTTSKQPGCQIDYMIQTRYRTIFLFEVKFSRNEITSKVIKEVETKIKNLILPKGYSCFPVLIHVNTVSDTVLDACYFSKIIDFGSLLKNIS